MSKKFPQLSKFIITPVSPKQSRVRVAHKLHKDFRRHTNRQILKACYTGVVRHLGALKSRGISLLARHDEWRVFVPFRLFKFEIRHYKVGWKDVIIAFLFGVIVSMAHLTHAQTIGGVVPSVTHIKPQTALKPTNLTAQAHLDSIYVAPAVVPTVVSGCGDNQYANFIYMHESGCRTTALNSIGCYGIGQACPASKIAQCGADYTCQNAWFTNYANVTYGGWAGAYAFWVSHHWW